MLPIVLLGPRLRLTPLEVLAQGRGKAFGAIVLQVLCGLPVFGGSCHAW
jgi:hypothetical protein